MTDYLKRFHTMVTNLQKQQNIEIVEFIVGRPASVRALKAVEHKLGAPLAAPIRSFYQQANGIKLHWQIKPDVSPEIAKTLRKRSTDYYVKIAEYFDDPFAIVNLLPVEETFVAKKRKELTLGTKNESIEFGGKTFERKEFSRRLKPFDVMNRELCMAFLIETGNGDPHVLLLTEGYTDWTSSRLTDFASYMEMLLVTRGIVEARKKIFGAANGDRKPSLVRNAAEWRRRYVPKLFRI